MKTVMDRALLEILARRGRVELIRTLKSFPDRDFTINELARVSGVATMTTWRAVGEFKSLAIVRVRRVGNARAVRITRDGEKLRLLRLIEDTDPQKAAARRFASIISGHEWGVECRLFGSIGRGEHLPGEEVDIAVVFDDRGIVEEEAKAAARDIAIQVKEETNVTIVPLCVSAREMGRKGGLASELKDKERIWSRDSD
jgi:predicted nucleotidyltransferase